MIAGERPTKWAALRLLHAMKIICEQEPKPLRDTPSGIAHVDGDLQAIVLKALAKGARATLLERRGARRGPRALPPLRSRARAHAEHGVPAAQAGRTPQADRGGRGLAPPGDRGPGDREHGDVRCARSRGGQRQRQVSVPRRDARGRGAFGGAWARHGTAARILDRTAERVRTELKAPAEVAAGISMCWGRRTCRSVT